MRRRLIIATLAGCLLAAAPAEAIVNGSPASDEYPWMAALLADGTQMCGATLVRPDWVLTAAHCPHGEDVAKLSVVLGRHRLSAGGGEEIPVDRVVMHEDWSDDDIGNGHDLALLHLARTAARPLMRVVSPSEPALWAPGRPARVIGWGAAAFGLGDVRRSDDLMEVDEPMVSDADCDFAYNTAGSDFDPATMVCAGEKTEYKGHCQGDSGGPLLVRDAAGGWTQVGVVSFGTGCGHPMFFGVFGRIGAPALNEVDRGAPAAAAGATRGSRAAARPRRSG